MFIRMMLELLVPSSLEFGITGSDLSPNGIAHSLDLMGIGSQRPVAALRQILVIFQFSIDKSIKSSLRSQAIRYR
jgi:hypothetical protein